jgi:polysaccharide export outer membrane protein
MKRLKLIGLAVIAIHLLLFSSESIFAQQYKIGPEDVLQISFWQDPSLNQVVTVRQDGKITLSVIGEISAAGLTPQELANKIGDQVSRYNKQISQATVEVLQYNSQKVYITGQVLNPGKYSFEELPNAWELVKEAGGVTEQGDLSNVVIIRGSVNKGEIVHVNLANLIAEGDPSKYPELYPEDIVEVKRTTSEAGPGLPSRTGAVQRKNIVYVIGRVGTPGAITLEENMDCLDAIALAGGPTDDADLGQVRIFNKQDPYSNVIIVDIEKRSEKGTPPRYTLRPEDTILIPTDEGGFWGTLGKIRDLVTIFGAVVTTYLLIDRLSD